MSGTEVCRARRGVARPVSRVYLDVFVSRLRAKLGGPNGPRYIETERGRGYRFTRLLAVRSEPQITAPTRMLDVEGARVRDARRPA
jgi:DNA-binding winged helix-turn-helix (wHTH) protein